MSGIPFKAADILIPKSEDMGKWSVVACDQYTSEPEYWENVKQTVGDSCSTLNMIFPEVYLNNNDAENRIDHINKTMEKYLNDGIFRCISNCLVYVKRTVSCGKIRHGIIGCVDLEYYDYNKGAKSLIRATEGTVLERIPPRVKIRKNAKLELPHIMLLIDDPQKSVIEKVNIDNSEKIYDFDLMAGGGHICGYAINAQPVIDSLTSLYEKITDDNKLLFAVGDGNHSLATAKECWEEIKSSISIDEQKTNPARFALVELINIHDDALEFEPIHRVVFNCNPTHLINSLKKYYPQWNNDGNGQKISYVYGKNSGDIYIPNAPSQLNVGTLQHFLDDYLKENNGSIDYIHGNDITKKLAEQDNAIGFLLPAMEKSQLFKTVIADGALPRKTFSMGEPCEKRFYLECRKVR